MALIKLTHPPGSIFGGALIGFILARLQHIDINRRFCPRVPASDGSTGFPSACYWVVHFSRYRAGMILHLSTSLPAGLLAVFQFVPGIRHSAIMYHRIAGYTAVTLAVIGNVGALMITDTAMGGDMATRTFIGLVALVTTATFGMAIYNVRRQQLDGHRAWMLRTWAYLGFIVSLRILQAIMTAILTRWPSTSGPVSIPCAELRYIYLADENREGGYFAPSAFDAFDDMYPTCKQTETGPSTDAVLVAVEGWLGSDRGQTVAVSMSTFAAAGILALILHAVVVEIYLNLTSAETERLRMVSHQRQLDKGYKNPGSAGIVAQRFGDAHPWVPPEARQPKPASV